MGKSGRVVAIAVVVFGLCAVAIFFLFGPWKAPGGVHALAVLPLRSSAGSAEDDALGRAISASLMRRLDATGAVTLSPTAAGADSLLEGSVYREAGRLRVDARLFRAGDGRTLWKESFDVPASEAARVENAIFEAVASRLRLK
jgi:TolB-like protein